MECVNCFAALFKPFSELHLSACIGSDSNSSFAPVENEHSSQIGVFHEVFHLSYLLQGELIYRRRCDLNGEWRKATGARHHMCNMLGLAAVQHERVKGHDTLCSF